MGLVRTERLNGVAVVTLDDPRRRNALSLAMAGEVKAAFDALASSDDVGAVVVTGLPTIAAVNGPAVGAGLNLALACDVRVAGRSARFESRFTDLALHPGGGHTWMLRQLLGGQGAAAVVLCGEPLDGEAAVRRGLAWACVDDHALLDEACRLAGRAAAAPRELMTRLKATLRKMSSVTDHDEAVTHELEAQLWSVDQPEFRERLAALKRKISS